MHTLFLRFIFFISFFLQSAAFAGPQSLPAGWSMVGNDSAAAIDVVAVFGSKTAPAAISSAVTTVWSWNNSLGRWNFFSPGLTSQELSNYAASKNYGVLSSIAKGEGFWVNAKTQFIYDPSIVATTPEIDNISGRWIGPGSDASGPGSFDLNFSKTVAVVTGSGSACDTLHTVCFIISQIDATMSSNYLSGKMFYKQSDNINCNGVLNFSANIVGTQMNGTYYGTNSCWGQVTNGIFSLQK